MLDWNERAIEFYRAMGAEAMDEWTVQRVTGDALVKLAGRCRGGLMAWVLLVIGGLFEIGFTTCLRYVDGFRNIGWTLGFLGVGGAVRWRCWRSRRASIPMGTAYAVWGGIGALGTVIVGIAWFGEPASLPRAAADPGRGAVHRRAEADRALDSGAGGWTRPKDGARAWRWTTGLIDWVARRWSRSAPSPSAR